MNWLQATRMLLTLHCEDSAKLMSESYERPLSSVEHWAVRLHLIGCGACRRFRKHLHRLQELSTRLSERSALSAEDLAEARQRLSKRLKENLSPGE